ncbi:MAG TPA: hypothetical protein HPP66_10420 [Planctomycetes bacterium]|nr:hypothetical protein [Planctomycetota bacterium]
MRKQTIVFSSLTLVILSACALSYGLRGRKVPIDEYNSVARLPSIRPDYCETVIPPNIAPLNFVVQEKGLRFCVKIHSKQGKPIEVFSRNGKIVIPEGRWQKLLNTNRRQQLCFDVSVKTGDDERWNRFQTITNEIARENIDGFLVYRRIHPAHSTWRKMGLYQRNLQNYNESLILDNGYYGRGCLNCHTFCENRTDKMLIGIRSSIYGSSALLIEDGVVNKIDAKFGYSSWHPSGRLAAYSINKIRLFFHSAGDEVRGVTDLDSLLAYYLVDSGTVKTAPQISKKERLETYPAWSADGRWLYFCSAPILWSDRDTVPPERYDQVKYDLVRVSYDLDRDEWGEPETVLSAEDTGLTILLPRVSPDGRRLLFCMCDYGSFPVYHDSSDLYLIDLKNLEETGRVKPQRLQINSDKSESWHSWSSNSRWIAFSSKRQSGVFTRSYLSYVDEGGRVYKPLLLPQKDPTHYDSCLWTYSVPELVTGPVRVTKEKLGRVVRGSRKISVRLPITSATPKPGVVPGSRQIWQERE